ncbi:hypothetical protein JAAARDRAFT_125659 [Jaapia argillacea MUCL 33604]|uniref:ribonuclease Z n=1 Tax=Jaapia argillacea MUCL 33604 TaxID=933084 RepID=A0A067QCJ4_9AGAM|nr:hypothetical protein JAAARDRAFT_125659 [Jaapia argillacea MUCL 33604]
MNWSTSVISTISSDTDPVISVTFDSAKYIFNASENTSRAFLQSPCNHWGRARAVFLTDVGTQRSAGLAGLLMTLTDGGLRDLSVVGPPGLTHLLATMRFHVRRKGALLEPVEITPDADLTSDATPTPVFKDSNVSVYAIPVSPDIGSFKHESSPSNTMDCSASITTQPSSSKLKRKRAPSPQHSSKRTLVRTSEEEHSANHSPQVDSLDRVRQLPAFSPSPLEGEMAQEWRRLLIKSMIYGHPSATLTVNDAEDPPSSKKGKGKRSASEPTANRSYPSQPVGWYHRLPRFQPPSEQNAGFSRASKSVMSYLLVGPEVRGKFDAQKAETLGVRGFLRGQLTRGKTITFKVDDGNGRMIERVVKPEDCVGPPEKPSAILILDIPSQGHIESLTSTFVDSPFFEKFRSQTNTEYKLQLVYHLCGEGVLTDDRYKAFMNGFGENVHHVVASPSHLPDPVTFTSVGYNQLKLNALDAQMFPIPTFSTTPKVELSSVPNLPNNIVPLQTNLVTQIRPFRPPTLDQRAIESDRFHPAAASTLSLSRTTTESFSSSQQTANDAAELKGSGDDVTIVPLGTSSAVPTRYRNVSGTLIMIPRWGSVLFDAGEGSYGQISRFFSKNSSDPQNADETLRNLKCIFVSHTHGDHHMGVAKILRARRQLEPSPPDPLFLVAPNNVILYLREFDDIEDLGFSDRDSGVVAIVSDTLVDSGTSRYGRTRYGPRGSVEDSWNNELSFRRLVKDMCEALGLDSFTTVPVNHGVRCFGAVLRHKQGWTIVFSGDTMPCADLVEAGMNSTLLIHEATMGDDQLEIAAAKAHSTVGQAITAGTQMDARNILLTHFSARYPKMPPSLLDSGEPSEKPKPVIGVALDGARISIGNMRRLNAYLPAIEQMFLDVPDEDDVDAAMAE